MDAEQNLTRKAFARVLRTWQLLLVLVPAAELILLGAVAHRWGPFLFPHDEYPELTLLIANLPIALALSVVLGFWFAARMPWAGSKFAGGVLFGMGIAVISFSAAFAGCSLMGLN